MNGASIACGAAAGLAAGVGLWRWLRDGGYRRPEDEPRLQLGRAWLVVPGAGAAGAAAGMLPSWWLITVGWVYLVGAVALVWIDLDVHRVPDRVLVWWAPAVSASVLMAAGMQGWGLLWGASAGAAAMGALFLVLGLVGSMGLGDVKLAAVTGLAVGALGAEAVVTTVVSGFAVAALAGICLLARGADRQSHLAFGPAIVVGAVAAIARAGFGF